MTHAIRRSRSFRTRALRLWFGVGERVAPDAAERQAAALMLTPIRRSGPARIPVPAPDVTCGRQAFTLEADGLRLAGWSWGSGPVVILVHGWQGTATQMAPLASALVRVGYRAVLFDLPAHGSSAGRSTSIPECARALRIVADAVGAGACDAIIAHSFGATSAIFAMAGGLKTTAVALLAPAAGPAAFIDRYTRLIGLSAARVPGLIRRLEERVGVKLAEIDATQLARSLDAPALILHDKNDDQVPWSHGMDIANAWRDSTLVEATGLGHGGILTDTDSIGIVTDFVRWHVPVQVRS
jgi:pimeloyl-ACP methyl ester carboxylesterase